MRQFEPVPFEVLKGKTIVKINREHIPNWNRDLYEFIKFEMDNGEQYWQYHEQNCCENVSVEEIHGDLDDLLNTPILLAEETVKRETSEDNDSQTWTFYKLSTIKGSVTIRWYGTSNGCYSEQAELYLVNNEVN